MTAPWTEPTVRSASRYGFTLDLLTLAIALILALRVGLRVLYLWHRERARARRTAACHIRRLVLR